MKTNEEKAKELADCYAGEYDAALAMAQWKDEQLEAEKQALIDKACEWWEDEFTFPEMTQDDMFCKERVIENFKQAMEEDEQ